jgi:hypothetical protein
MKPYINFKYEPFKVLKIFIKDFYLLVYLYIYAGYVLLLFLLNSYEPFKVDFFLSTFQNLYKIIFNYTHSNLCTSIQNQL